MEKKVNIFDIFRYTLTKFYVGVYFVYKKNGFYKILNLLLLFGTFLEFCKGKKTGGRNRVPKD